MSFDFGLKTMTQASANGVGPLCTFIQTIETSLPWREHSYQLSIFLTEILWWNSQIAILDATKHIQFADLYDVPEFPTLILFEHGVPVARHKGARDIESLLAFLESNLSGK
jgi:thioredoxin-like negative regulator of GroEL